MSETCITIILPVPHTEGTPYVYADEHLIAAEANPALPALKELITETFDAYFEFSEVSLDVPEVEYHFYTEMPPGTVRSEFERNVALRGINYYV